MAGPSAPPSTKLYFRIGEVAAIVGVEPHVLRYWEREFRMIRPTKSAKGQRVYSRRDLENLLRVRDLLYGEGFTIAGAKRRLQRKGTPPPQGDDLPDQTLDSGTDSGEESEYIDGSEGLEEDVGARQAGPIEDARDGARQTLVDLRSEIEAFLTSDEWSPP